jgi:hypothetical protein
LGKILLNINVPKQSNHAGCWAVSASALANAVGNGPHTEASLVQKYKTELTKAGSFSVTKALAGLNIASTDRRVEGADFNSIIEEIRSSIDNDKPVVVGIKVANDALKWKADGAPFTMGHALVCFGYHEANSGQLFFKDPARPDDNRLIYNAKELKDGFVYMNISDLGPQTREKLVVSDGQGAIVMKMSSAVIMTSSSAST